MIPRIRNTRLYALLLRGTRGSARRPEPPRPPALQLLGDGLDAVICRTRVSETHWLWRLLSPGKRSRKRLVAADAEQAARDRLDRYYTAMLLCSPWNIVERERREVAGEEVKQLVRTHRWRSTDNVIPFQRDRATK